MNIKICKTRLDNQKGAALVLALYMVALLTVLTVGMLNIGVFETKSAMVNVQQPYYRAVSALNKIMFQIKENDSLYPAPADPVDPPINYSIDTQGYGEVDLNVSAANGGARIITILPEDDKEFYLEAKIKVTGAPHRSVTVQSLEIK